MRGRLFEAFPYLPDSCFGGGQPVPVAECIANVRELTGHMVELTTALGNGICGIRFRHCIVEILRRSLYLLFQVSCVSLRVAARGMSLENKIEKHFQFCGERSSRPDFGSYLIAVDRFGPRTAGRRCYGEHEQN